MGHAARAEAVEDPTAAAPCEAVRVRRERVRLVVVCGLPGAGKTTLATRLATELDAVRMTPDDWLAHLQLDIWDGELRGRIERLQWSVAKQLLESRRSVVVDFGSWSRAERDELRSAARGLGVDVELHFLDAPIDVLFERTKARGREAAWGRAITRAEMEEWSALIERPTEEELALFDNQGP